MSRKRQLSPVSLPQPKRRAVESWITAVNPDISPKAEDLLANYHSSSNGCDHSPTCASTCSMGPKSDISNKVPTVRPNQPGYSHELRLRRVFDFDEEVEAVGPSNLDELRRIMYATRESPQFSKETHNGIKQLARSRSNEAGLLAALLPEFAKEDLSNSASPIRWKYDKQWLNYFPLSISEDPRLSTPKPDRSIGFKAHVFDDVMDKDVTRRLRTFVTVND